MGKIISRPLYIKRIQGFIGKNLIKVIVGQRRVGKSFILKQLIRSIEEDTADANIIYIDKELNQFNHISDHQELYNYVKQQCQSKKMNFLFIDEVQEIKAFEKGLRNLHAEENIDIYCTGSNANLLSGELATLLSGRYIEFRISPLSYPEFLEFHQLENSNESLMQYIKFGGLPFLIHLERDELLIFDYLRNIYSTILFKDIVKRFNIRNISFLESLVNFLANNTGSLVSAKKISDFLKSQKINISVRVVLDYISYFNTAFFINRAGRYDISGKKHFETVDKRYFEDIGLRNAIAGYSLAHIGQIIENIVYNHLIICGYEVFVGQLGANEIDFVCTRKSEKIYVQVAYLIPNQKTIDREFGNLLKVKDNYPKFVVSMDEVRGNSIQGIQHFHLREFLSKYLYS